MLFEVMSEHAGKLTAMLMSCPAPCDIGECLGYCEAVEEVGPLYDEVAAAWQAVLDERNISHSEIGLSERLL